MVDTFSHRLFRLEAAENFMRQLTSPQTLGFSHYQYLVYAYFGIRDGELWSTRDIFFPFSLLRKGKREPGSRGGEKEIENCNREGVLRGTFPSLPTVCSFRAATPYLQVQCLLSLIHIPWPTHPYYPWLSTGLRAHPSPKCTCLYRVSQKAIVVYTLRPLSLSLQAWVCVSTSAYVYAQRTSATDKVVSFLSRLCFWEFIREALVVDLRTTKEPFNFNFRIIYVFLIKHKVINHLECNYRE